MIYKVKARETIASLVAAVGLTATYLPPTSRDTLFAIVQAIGGDVRFTVEGTTPVAATTGHRLVEDGTVELWGAEMTDFLAIDDGGTAELEVTYYGSGQ